jgi:DNA polymerase-1
MAGNYKPKREGYVSDIPTVRENENWKNLFKFTCIRNLDELRSIKDLYLADGAPVMSLDSETTSLSIIDLEIVGFSFCWGKGRAYYVPVGHKLIASPTGMGQFDIYTNLPMEGAMAILCEMVYAAQRVVFFNYRYDARVFRKYEMDMMKIRHYDIQVLIWNLDTNMPYPSLKDSSLRFLGVKQQTFYELVSGREQDMNISYLSPEVVYEYAAADALCTYLLWVRWTSFLENNQAILELDNELERVLMFLEELPVWFDRNYALQLAASRQQKIAGLKEEIFELCGVTFEVDSNKQLAEALLNAGVPLYKKTEKSGQFMTNEEALQEFEKEYPVVRKIMEYRTTTKELSTNIMPFLNMEGEYCHIKYNSKDVPTGRLSSGGADRKNTGTAFFLPMNIMSVPKPHAAFYMPEPYDGPDSVLGYRFVLIPKKVPGCVQGFDLDNVRRVIHAPAGFYYVAMDYDAEELVVAANLSRDRVFLDPLTRGEDPHDAVGLQMFGEEYVRAQHRKIMKILNYGCLYGGNGWTIQKQMPERSIEECDGYVERWSQVHRQYWNFMAGCTKFAKEHGYIKTAMGRIRRVRHWYQAQGKYGFANRTVWNTQIQGLSADIMRYVLVGIFYDIMMNPEFNDKFQFMADIHDEIDSIITRDLADFTRIATKVQGIMTNLPEPMASWEKPLTTGISVGPSWGELYPFVLQDGVWLPKVES